jgi:hypothetical protein
MTSAERQAKWRLSHSKVNDVLSPPTLLLACHPTGQIDLDELEESAAKTMELYNKLASCRTCTCASSKVQFSVRRRRYCRRASSRIIPRRSRPQATSALCTRHGMKADIGMAQFYVAFPSSGRIALAHIARHGPGGTCPCRVRYGSADKS